MYFELHVRGNVHLLHRSKLCYVASRNPRVDSSSPHFCDHFFLSVQLVDRLRYPDSNSNARKLTHSYSYTFVTRRTKRLRTFNNVHIQSVTLISAIV